MKIINNLGNHDIVIYDDKDCTYDSATRKHYLNDGANPTQVIPPSGTMMSIQFGDPVIIDTINGVNIYSTPIKSLDNVPNDGNLHVVSGLYHSAALAAGLDMSRLVTINCPVYGDSSNPRPVGCLGLKK